MVHLQKRIKKKKRERKKRKITGWETNIGVLVRHLSMIKRFFLFCTICNCLQLHLLQKQSSQQKKKKSSSSLFKVSFFKRKKKPLFKLFSTESLIRFYSSSSKPCRDHNIPHESFQPFVITSQSSYSSEGIGSATSRKSLEQIIFPPANRPPIGTFNKDKYDLVPNLESKTQTYLTSEVCNRGYRTPYNPALFAASCVTNLTFS